MKFRVHITCSVGQTTFEDFKTQEEAFKRFHELQDKEDFYADAIEELKGEMS